MPTIGKLNAILSMNTAAFSAGAKSAASSLKGIGSAASSINGILAGIGVGISVAGVVALTKSSMEAIDTNAKLADRLGMTTESLAGMQLAADLAGVGADAFATATTKLEKGIGEAITEGGEIKAAFDQLGVSAQALANMTPDQQMRTLADAFAQVESPAVRTKLALDLFGKSGAGMINVLAGGAESFDYAQKKAELFGLAVNRVDSAKVEAANDSITELKGVFTGLGNTLAVGLAPFITAATQSITEFITQSGGIKGLVFPAIEMVASGVGYLANGLEALNMIWNAVKMVGAYTFQGINQDIQYIIKGVAWIVDGLNWLNEMIKAGSLLIADGIVRGIAWVIEGIQSMLQGVSKLPDWLGGGLASDAAGALGRTAAAMRKFSEETLVAGADKSIENAQKPTDVADSMRSLADSFFGSNASYWNEIAQYSADAMGKSFDDLMNNRPHDRVMNAFEEIRAQAESSAQAVAENAEKMKGGFDAAAAAAEKNAESVQKIIDKLKEQAATAGMTESQKKIYELQQANATPEQLATAQGLLDDIDLKNRAAAVIENNKKAVEDAMTPLEKAKANISELNMMKEKGLLTDQDYDIAVQREMDTFAKSADSNQEFGTIEKSRMTVGGVYMAGGTTMEKETRIKGMDQLTQLTREVRDSIIDLTVGVN